MARELCENSGVKEEFMSISCIFKRIMAAIKLLCFLVHWPPFYIAIFTGMSDFLLFTATKLLWKVFRCNRSIFEGVCSHSELFLKTSGFAVADGLDS